MWWLIVAACAPKTPIDGAVADPGGGAADDPAAIGVVSPALRRLLIESWNAQMARFPEWSSQVGDHRFDDRLFDPSEPARIAWLDREQDWVLRLAALPEAMLDPNDRVTRDLLLGQLSSALAVSACRYHEWSVSARSNALVDANGLAEDSVVDTVADGRNLVARYRALPAAIDAQSDNLRRGVAAGRVGVRESLEKVVAMLDDDLAGPLDAAALTGPARKDHPTWSPEELATFRADLTAAAGDVRAALGRYRDLVRDSLVPAGRVDHDIGLHALPGGDACYAAAIRDETTLDLSPDALHETGLRELASIHDEFRALGAKTLGTDDLAQIFARLRSDPALHFSTAEEIRAKAEEALRRAEAAVPSWFGRVPRSPCEVDVIPDYLAPYTTIAYYQQVRPDGSKPGIYYVNVYEPASRPRFESEVLAFHESVPGHHLQIALAQEQGELPAFRKYGGATAFVEGWALYGERLADEMGLYSGDLDRLGMLSFDTWRASRLVVDTGIHAKGWSRAEAIAFMLENTPLAENNVENEVDRYVTTPGQALAYKTGQLEIRALRADAEAALGPAFDLAQFHDVVLGGGAVSLPVLRDQVHGWVDRTAAIGE